ncbi:MAG: hypothetical protein ACLGH6_01635 [Gammaproteobacteria bacterium]
MTTSSADLPTATTSGARPLPSKRDLETLLRTGGLSARQAKKLLARGYNAITTDSEAVLLDEFEALTRRIRGTDAQGA